MKMSKEQFAAEIVKKVRADLPDGLNDVLDFEVKDILKQNDQHKTGIVIMKGENSANPVVYIDGYYKAYEDGAFDLDFLVKCVAVEVMNSIELAVPKGIALDDFGDLKDRLIFCLADSKMNEEKLAETICRPLDCGLSEMLCIDVKGFGRAVVTKNITDVFDCDEDKLMEIAKANMEKLYPAVLTPMSKAIPSLRNEGLSSDNLLTKDEITEYDTDEMLYILSNEDTMFGASSLFYHGMAERIGDVLKGSYYALPSSIHEFMIFKDFDTHEKSRLLDTVREGNKLVTTDEILSYKIFRYDYGKRELSTIVA